MRTIQLKINIYFIATALFTIVVHSCLGSQQGQMDSLYQELNAATNNEAKLYLLKNFLEHSLKYTQHPEEALELANLGLQLADTSVHADEAAFFCHELAVTYFYLGDYQKSMKFSMADLELCERRKDTVGTVIALDNIGNIPFVTGDYEKALEHYLRSLRLSELILCDYTYYLYTSVGRAYLGMKDFENAARYFEKSLANSRESNHQTGIAMSYFNLSKLNHEKGNDSLALQFAIQCHDIRKSLKNDYELIEVKNLLASLLLQSRNYIAALEFAQNAYLLAKKIGFTDQQVLSLTSLSAIYMATKNYQKAFEYEKQYSLTRDELLNEEKLKQIKRLEIDHELKQKQHEVALLAEKNNSKELKIQKKTYLNYLLVAMILFFIVAGTLITKQYRFRMREKNILLERKLLRTQMNPHFIFNSLIAIQSFLFKKNEDQAASFLSKYAELMRLILENSRQEYISLDKEIKTLTYYLELQKLRFENKIDFEVKVDPDIPLFNVLIPPMLSQPFLENAIEHGFNGLPHKGKITLDFQLKEEVISIEIIDNGIGRNTVNGGSKKIEVKHLSLATKITKERLMVLNRQRKNKIKLEIQDLVCKEGNALGTKVCFIIPIKYGWINKAV